MPRAEPFDFASLPGPTALSTEATLAARWASTLRTHWETGERQTGPRERDELRNEAVSQVVKFLDARSAP